MNLLLMAHILVHAVSFFQNGEETTSGYERLLNAVTLKRSSCREEKVPPLRDSLICSLCFFFFKANIKVRCYKSTSAVTLRQVSAFSGQRSAFEVFPQIPQTFCGRKSHDR